MNRMTKVAVLSGAIIGLAGCGMGGSGPSSHTVKRLAANKMYATILQMGTAELQLEAPILNEQPSASYLKNKAFAEKLRTHKARYLHKIESSMHEKGCTKAGDATYDCSIIMHNHKTHQKRTIIVKVGKAGHIWSLVGIKAD